MFGRLPACDVSLDHPSISRYHAILQYRPQGEARGEGEGEGEGERSVLFSNSPSEAGFYVYDLNSTHGTYLNKNRIQPRSYYRVRVGQMVRFGGSSRLFVLEVREGGKEGGEEGGGSEGGREGGRGGGGEEVRGGEEEGGGKEGGREGK